MAATHFVDEETVIEADWLNEADNLVHDIFNNPSTPAAALAAISNGLSDLTTATVLTLSDAAATLTVPVTINNSDQAEVLTLNHDSGDFTKLVLSNDGAASNAEIYLAPGGQLLIRNINTVATQIFGYPVILYQGTSERFRITDNGIQVQSTYRIDMNQSTADTPFFNFQGTVDADTTSGISSLTTSGATTHHIQVYINGSKAWIAASTNNPS